MKVIKGNDTKVYVNGIQIFCGQDCTFSERKDTVETVGAIGIWKYNRLQKKSWGIDVNGLAKVNNTDGQEDYFTMISDPFSTAPQTITITFVDEDGNTDSITGVMWLQKSSISGPSKEFAKALASFVGTGEYILDTGGTSGSSSTSGSGITSCVPIAAGDTFAPPDAVLYTPYSYSFPLTGTLPYNIDGETVPGFMTASIIGSNLVLGGTPDNTSLADATDVGFDLSNACGTLGVSATIDVHDSGRNVSVINNTGASIDIYNDHLTIYTIVDGTTGNFQMQSANFSVLTMTGTHDIDVLQSLPSGILNTIVAATAPNTYASSDFSNTNYLRFNA